MTNPIQITHVPLESITPSPMNPRKHFDSADIAELAQSIAVKGVLQPILVRPNGKKNHYEIVAGERRYRASKTLGTVTTIPAIIRDISDEEAMEIQIIENLQRQDISPMEEAVGFKNLIDFKKMDLKEIAHRVGKSPSYVAQRVKLNDLIPFIQTLLYEGRIRMVDATILCKMPAADQNDIYKSEMKGRSGMIELNRWMLNKYQHNLMNAPFDITDESIIPSMGACINCQFNSGSNGELFPEQAKSPICQNRKCFQDKCDKSFSLELKKSKDDPAIVLLSTEYGYGRDLSELNKKYPGILMSNEFDTVREPEYPDKLDDFDPDDYNTPEECEADFQKAIDRYNVELAAFNKKIATGGIIKAFVVHGGQQGKYVFGKIKKSTAAKKVTASKNGTEDESDIKGEIERIKERAKRSKELDDAKIWENMQALFDPTAAVKDPRGSNDNPLSELEIKAFASALSKNLNYTEARNFEKLFKNPKQNDLRPMIRFFFFDIVPPSYFNGKFVGDSLLMKQIAEEYWPEKVAKIVQEQNEVADRREARINSRLSALQKKLKEIKKPVPSAPKKSGKPSLRKKVTQEA